MLRRGLLRGGGILGRGGCWASFWVGPFAGEDGIGCLWMAEVRCLRLVLRDAVEIWYSARSMPTKVFSKAACHALDYFQDL